MGDNDIKAFFKDLDWKGLIPGFVGDVIFAIFSLSIKKEPIIQFNILTEGLDKYPFLIFGWQIMLFIIVLWSILFIILCSGSIGAMRKKRRKFIKSF